jgi:ribosome-binding factor A
MPKEYNRAERVASALQRILANLIHKEISDPRIKGLVTINEVVVSKDLAYAKVYISILGQEDDSAAVVDVLNGAQGYLQKLLSRELKLRIVPRLKFYHDTLQLEANRISLLIDQVMKDDPEEN